mmetsp:Transcript_17733/g.46294  ORF Transcript_17733/g.46294 Transcript_17733/m.46294 type:complete len:849 (+) Transcript_17733:65-2611(+)
MQLPVEAVGTAAFAVLLFAVLTLGFGGAYTFAMAVATAGAVAFATALLGSGVRKLLWPVSAILFEQLLQPRYEGYNSTTLTDLESFKASPVYATARKTIRQLIDEYIISWYAEYSKDPEPPEAMRQMLEHATEMVFLRAAATDRHAFAQDCIAVLRRHIANVQRARLATGGSGLLEFGPSQEALIQHFESLPGAKHPATESKEMETRYLCEVAEALTTALFPPVDTSAKLQFHLLARTMLSCSIVPMLDNMVHPDYLYQTVVYIMDDTITPKDGAGTPDGDSHIRDVEGDESDAEDPSPTEPSAAEGHVGGFPSTMLLPPGGGAAAATGPHAPDGEDGAAASSGYAYAAPGSNGILDEGFLERGPSSGIAGTAQKEWKNRYVKITRSAIILYKDEAATSIVSEVRLKIWPRVFPVDEIGDGRIFCVATRTESHYFRAPHVEDRKRWLKTFDLIFQLRNENGTDLATSIRPGLTLPKYTVTVTRYQRMLDHAEYCLLIRRVRGGATTSATSWEISRRFREFHRLHKLLCSKSKFAVKMKGIQLPQKKMTFSQGELTVARLEGRRVALDNYLQAVCSDWDLGTSYELCQFLSNKSVLFPNTRESARRGVVNKVSRVTTTFKGRVTEFAETTLKAHQLRKSATAPQELVFVRRAQTDRSEIDGENPFRHFLRRVAGWEIEAAAAAATPVMPPREPVVRPSEECYPGLMLRLGFELMGYGDISVLYPNLYCLLNNLGGGVLERFGRAEIDSYFAEECWASYAKTMSASIWAEEESPRSPEEMAATKSKAFALLKECVPDLSPFIEQHEVDEALLCYLACFRSQRLNRACFLKLLDVALKHFLQAHDEDDALL